MGGLGEINPKGAEADIRSAIYPADLKVYFTEEGRRFCAAASFF